MCIHCQKIYKYNDIVSVRYCFGNEIKNEMVWESHRHFDKRHGRHVKESHSPNVDSKILYLDICRLSIRIY